MAFMNKEGLKNLKQLRLKVAEKILTETCYGQTDTQKNTLG